MMMSNDLFDDDETALHPLTPEEAYSPVYWRARADQVQLRACAEADDAVVARLQRIAADYRRLAERAAAILIADQAA
jgi:hypothetical protein